MHAVADFEDIFAYIEPAMSTPVIYNGFEYATLSARKGAIRAVAGPIVKREYRRQR